MSMAGVHHKDRKKRVADGSKAVLTGIHVGRDRVRLKPFRLGQKGWNKGTVVARLDERSYDIETPDGMYRRNRVHIRKDTVLEDAVPTAQRSAVHRQEPVEMSPQPMSNADNRPNRRLLLDKLG